MTRRERHDCTCGGIAPGYPMHEEFCGRPEPYDPPSRQEQQMTDSDIIRTNGTDAALWAASLATHTGDILDPTPGGTLHAWLCTIIETARSAGASREAHTGEYRRGLVAADVLPVVSGGA